MSDLISRKETYNELIESIDWLRKRDYELYCVIGDSIRVCLDEQPTAFDVDKVVEELYEEKTEILLSNDYEYEIINYCLDNFDNAIKIVKQGSDANNVCEWKKLPFSWFAGCDGRKVEYKQGDYCPRCGKKIKVVE